MDQSQAQQAAYRLAVHILQKQGGKELARALKAGTSQRDVAQIAVELRDIITELQRQAINLTQKEGMS